ncbi:histidine phosphatase family protein, partial [Enterococcus faecium]
MFDGPVGEIVVLRHGQTEWSRTGQHTGTTDLPLLPEGEDQARGLRAALGGREFVEVRVSPLQR